MGCLFCKVVSGEVPAKIVLSNDHVVAFNDLRPVAPTHVLVVPRRHIVGVHDAVPEDAALLGELMLAGRTVAEQIGLGTDGYRLVINNGVNAGQSVFHLHLHVLGGRVFVWPPG